MHLIITLTLVPRLLISLMYLWDQWVHTDYPTTDSTYFYYSTKLYPSCHPNYHNAFVTLEGGMTIIIACLTYLYIYIYEDTFMGGKICKCQQGDAQWPVEYSNQLTLKTPQCDTQRGSNWNPFDGTTNHDKRFSVFSLSFSSVGSEKINKQKTQATNLPAKRKLS